MRSFTSIEKKYIFAEKMQRDINYEQAKEVSLGVLIRRGQYFARETLRKFWLLTAFAILGAIAMGVMAFLQPLEYRAAKDFVVNEEVKSGGGLPGLGLIGNLVGNSGGGAFDSPKVLALAVSDKIIYTVLFDTIPVNGQSDLVANHLIRIYDLHTEWQEAGAEDLQNFVFTDNDGEYSLLENIVIKRLAQLIRGNGPTPPLMQTGFTDATQFLTISIKSLDADLSYYLLEAIYKRLSDFYINRTTATQRQTYGLLKAKVDSVSALLDQTIVNIARFSDRNRGVFMEENSVPLSRYRQQAVMYQSMLGESVKNLETSAFMLQNATPIFQEVNSTIPPLPKVEENIFKNALIGAIVGLIIGVILVIVRAVVREALAAAEPGVA